MSRARLMLAAMLGAVAAARDYPEDEPVRRSRVATPVVPQYTGARDPGMWKRRKVETKRGKRRRK